MQRRTCATDRRTQIFERQVKRLTSCCSTYRFLKSNSFFICFCVTGVDTNWQTMVWNMHLSNSHLNKNKKKQKRKTTKIEQIYSNKTTNRLFFLFAMLVNKIFNFLCASSILCLPNCFCNIAKNKNKNKTTRLVSFKTFGLVR